MGGLEEEGRGDWGENQVSWDPGWGQGSEVSQRGPWPVALTGDGEQGAKGGLKKPCSSSAPRGPQSGKIKPSPDIAFASRFSGGGRIVSGERCQLQQHYPRL